MANKEWVNAYPHVEAIFLNPYISYHSPSLILFGENQIKEQRFGFFNYWANYHSMYELVKRVWLGSKWRGTLMYMLVQKLKVVKNELKIWAKQLARKNCEKLRIIQVELERIREAFQAKIIKEDMYKKE